MKNFFATIGRKISGGFFLQLLIQCLVGYFGVSGLAKVAGEFREFQALTREASVIADLHADILNERLSVMKLFKENSPENIKAYSAQSKLSDEAIENAESAVRAPRAACSGPRTS